MERVLRLLVVLTDAAADGVLGDRLIEVGGYGDSDPVSQLNRDIRQLREQGWRIDSVGGAGEVGRYRLAGGDNRLRLKLTEPQRVALQRAALLADRDDLSARLGLAEADRPQAVQPGPEVAGQGGELTTVMDAVRRARLLRFRYKGRDRVVHPGAVRHQSRQWYLSGIEDDDPTRRCKNFVVGRMGDVVALAPGTARPAPEARLVLHPLRWAVDEPTDVVLRTRRDYLPDVRRWLQDPERVLEPVLEGGGDIEVVFRVINRSAFRARVYALGRRVAVVSPPDFRDEMLAELAALSGRDGGTPLCPAPGQAASTPGQGGGQSGRHPDR